MARDRWSSRAIFLLAAIGSAVGLGNIWRFPYLAYEFGGGAFLVPYLIALVLLGIPLLTLEFAIGQKLQRGAVGTFAALHPRFRGLGWFALGIAFVIAAYYAVVMAWTVLYLIASPSLPWTADAEAYFFGEVLQITDSIGDVGGINWTVLAALLAVWVAIYLSVCRGVRTVGRVILLTVPLPVLLLFVLLVRAVTLPGFLDGWVYYIRPEWSALLSADVWLAAASQIFFTLTLGFGVMIAYASHKDETADIAGDSIVTAVSNSAISLLAGFVVFGVLGSMATATGVGVADVAASGPGLSFVVFPEALSLMPWAEAFSIVFFLTLLTLGIDSAFSLVEGINVAIHDTNPAWSRPVIALAVCAAAFAAGIVFTTRAGLYFLDVVDHFATNFGLVTVGLLEVVLVAWLYGAGRLRTFVNSVSDVQLGRWFVWALVAVIPPVLALLIVLQVIAEVREPYGGYPGWALAIGWAAVGVPFLAFLAGAARPRRGDAHRQIAGEKPAYGTRPR